jgi:sulfur-oxidizing protein SoxY
MGKLMSLALNTEAVRGPAQRRIAACACATALLLAAVMPAAAADNWSRIRPGLFQGKPIAEDSGQMLELVAPERAEDAAVVPVAIRTRLAQNPGLYVRRLYLIVDNNPAPLAAVFNLTPELGQADIETRVRVEEYTHIRAVAELSDGSLHMNSRYVKASGGCSAPAGKDPAAAAAGLGKMKLTLERTPQLNQPLLAQLMIRHPNSSGMAMDQVSRLYAPPHYVKHIEVGYNGRQILSVDTDISISENPNFRFYFLPKQDGALTVDAIDSTDLSFRTTLQVKAN